MTARQRAILSVGRQFQRYGGLREMDRLNDLPFQSRTDVESMKLGALTALTIAFVDVADALFQDCLEERSWRDRPWQP